MLDRWVASPATNLRREPGATCRDSVTTFHARLAKRQGGLVGPMPPRPGHPDSGINPGINPGIMGVPQGPVSLVESPHDDPFVPRALGFESHQPPQRFLLNLHGLTNIALRRFFCSEFWHLFQICDRILVGPGGQMTQNRRRSSWTTSHDRAGRRPAAPTRKTHRQPHPSASCPS